ncbi:MAG: nuclear transport factor 2 family protein [Flavobacteriales bacterium]|nr:nuclear transport factor 2 family protein [Flavobacteriales bacterium]MBK7100625.1 nuclear transport factor 2 family protein [Flavobacteriales bacterium]MBK7111321.1 nuclear transport factor 2 family protein [Flavobacteriales bacterium]MBK7484318.1 nuclear transport factor 2 family protein [Flavobacteriales bacterium]MBK8707482.1 nuclear transport factor 2 family protein [Flavobacteriales bacterium]
MSTIQRFYSAFQQHDWATMGACYHNETRFSDPVFPDLDAKEVRAMWKMLLTSGTDLRISFNVLEENATSAKVKLEAWYTFSRTKRPVHNRITTTIALKEGLIHRHSDVFDLWRWSRQALGMSGVLLGWAPLVRNKVRAVAAASLKKAMAAG